MNCQEFKTYLQKIWITEVACQGDLTYDTWYPIKNARFNHKPFCIVRCNTTEDVTEVIKLCVSNKKPFRVRSGGHQHEGMCSADDVVVIDLSGMNNIDINICDRTAWIGPGAPLKDVYKQLEYSKYTIPGGGCGTVCIGGLVQGGGWGMKARAGGLSTVLK